VAYGEFQCFDSKNQQILTGRLLCLKKEGYERTAFIGKWDLGGLALKDSKVGIWGRFGTQEILIIYDFFPRK